ncbi:MAG: hypothetical protein OXU61_10470 [Gammaproteobacteria bacterium]|nr:hypothetical protein [Gammaproteobacteria bacterium]
MIAQKRRPSRLSWSGGGKKEGASPLAFVMAYTRLAELTGGRRRAHTRPWPPAWVPVQPRRSAK